jgi:hypothetical protein
MEAVRTSETLVFFNEATRRSIPESCHLHIRRRENLKSHIIIIIRGATALTNLGRLSSRRWQSFPTAPDGTGLTYSNKLTNYFAGLVTSCCRPYLDRGPPVVPRCCRPVTGYPETPCFTVVSGDKRCVTGIILVASRWSVTTQTLFASWLVRLRFVVEEVALGQVLIRVLLFPCQCHSTVAPPPTHTHIYIYIYHL